MSERASMPTFVPRTVATFERTATLLARRAATPVRRLAARALSFADRLVGSWTGMAPTVGGFEAATRPALRAAERGGGMPLPRPWYDVDEDEQAIWPHAARVATTAATAAASAASLAVPAGVASVPSDGAQEPRVSPAAERGAAIALTGLTAAPEGAARGAGDAALSTTAREMRAAEALGLRTPIAAAPSTTMTPAAASLRATTPLARALGHAAWVDAQLRAVSANVEPTARATGGYVFVAAAEVARPAEPTRDAAPLVRGEVPTPTPVMARAVTPAAAWTAQLPDPRLAPTLPTRIAQRVAEFAAQLVGARSARDVAAPTSPGDVAIAATRADAAPQRSYVIVPDTTPASWRPGAAAVRVEQLGARVESRVQAAWGAPVGAATALTASAAGATDATLVVLRDALTATSTATPMTVPSAAAAAPMTVVSDRDAEASPIAARAPGLQTFVAPSPPAARATGPARLAQFMERLVGVQAARTLAPLPVQTSAAPSTTATASNAVDAAGAPVRRAPERVPLAASFTQAPVAARDVMATGDATARGNAAAVGNAAARDDAAVRGETASRIASERTGATARDGAMMLAAVAARPGAGVGVGLGAIGRRAEQIGGVVGVRAASLSIDFVDPARLSMLTPPMPTVAPVEPGRASDTIMPAARPLFAPAPASPPAFTAEEWSLVAAFPSAATAVQLAAARQAAQWQDVATLAQPARAPTMTAATANVAGRAAVAPSRTMLTAIDAATPPASVRDGEVVRGIAARGGAPTELVAPTVAAAPARLPGGRTPRGSFTWSRLADFSTAAADWTAPATVAVVEQAAQATPGTPLWGAMAPLVVVAPTLAATAAEAGRGAARASATSATTGGRGVPTAVATTQATTRDGGARGGAIDAGLPASGGARGGVADAMTPAPGVAGASSEATRPSRADAPAMTLMTAAATREARAAARLGTGADTRADVDADAPRVAPPLPLTGVDATRAASGVSNVRPVQAMPLMTSGPAPRDGAGVTPATGPSARALELARPFLRLVEGGVTGSDATRSSAPRFFEQPQPVVAGAPSSDSASRIVEALRHQPATAASDDRVSLADLTLIAIASATQQVAASPAGGGPGGGGSSSAAPSGEAAPAAGGQGGTSANPAQEIEELARAAFDELQRLIEVARERSGDHG